MNAQLINKAQHVLCFARSAMAGPSWIDAKAFADEMYGRHLVGDLVNKASLGPMSLADLDNELAASYVALMELVAAESIVGRLANLRKVPVDKRYLAFTSGATGYWVGEGKPRPLSRITLEGGVLHPLSINAIVVQTKEMVMASGKAAQDAFNRDLVRAIAAVLDETFILPSNSGSANVSPASVTHGVSALHSSGSTLSDVSHDIGLLLEDFTGDLGTATFVTDARTAANIALLGSIATIDVGARGGTLLGIPMITSRSSPRDSNGGQLALIDAAGIAYADDIPQFQASEAATVQMSDSPDDPVVANTVEISLWEHNLKALKVTQVVNWRAERAGSVALLSAMFPG